MVMPRRRLILAINYVALRFHSMLNFHLLLWNLMINYISANRASVFLLLTGVGVLYAPAVS